MDDLFYNTEFIGFDFENGTAPGSLLVHFLSFTVLVMTLHHLL